MTGHKKMAPNKIKTRQCTTKNGTTHVWAAKFRARQCKKKSLPTVDGLAQGEAKLCYVDPFAQKIRHISAVVSFKLPTLDRPPPGEGQALCYMQTFCQRKKCQFLLQLA